jgi:hypothetical protein
MAFFYFNGGSSAIAESKLEMKNYIGLYQLSDKKCTILKNSYNPCETSLFLELVKGQFYGIKNTEIALIFWTGDLTQTPELQYTARLLKKNQNKQLSDNKFWITKGNTASEYFIIKNNKLNKYVLEVTEKNQTTVRNISYTLKPVIRGNLPYVRLNYPGNK